jgi:hypothetical protein
MQDHFIPFAKYEQYLHMGGAESRIRAAIKHFGVNLINMPHDPMPDCTHDLKGTWYDLVGLRHIHGELDWAFKKGLIPPHYRYIEERYLLPIYNYTLVKEYWDTKNIEILNDWWRK